MKKIEEKMIEEVMNVDMEIEDNGLEERQEKVNLIEELVKEEAETEDL